MAPNIPQIKQAYPDWDGPFISDRIPPTMDLQVSRLPSAFVALNLSDASSNVCGKRQLSCSLAPSSPHTLQEYLRLYGSLPPGAREESIPPISLTARVLERRDASAKLYFVDIGTVAMADASAGNGAGAAASTPLAADAPSAAEASAVTTAVQVICSQRRLDARSHLVAKALRRGDWVTVTGFPGMVRPVCGSTLA